MRWLIVIILLIPALAEGESRHTSGAPGIDTRIVGVQEAPSITNIVPWKDKPVEIEKQTPTSFLLHRVLQPLDREVLMREIQYYRMLQEDGDKSGLFLE